MVAIGIAVELTGNALGTLGAGLLFVELFQLPSYVEYQETMGNYHVTLSPEVARQYTWAGRAGALLLAVAFALQFVATFL